jgi:hypothetical protein
MVRFLGDSLLAFRKTALAERVSVGIFGVPGSAHPWFPRKLTIITVDSCSLSMDEWS